MAIKFKNVHGKAKKGGTYFKFEEGDNTFRLVGEILPRYVYWKKDKEGNNIAIECLRFDRDKEEFTNVEKDWFQHYFPDAKCSWSYVGNVIDPDDPSKVILIGLKKKLWEQIETTAETLGDPTDLENGWDCVVKKIKTGPLPFNVEYQLKQLECKKRELTEEEKKAVSEMTPIDDAVKRPSVEDQKAFIEKTWINVADEDATDDSVAGEFEDSDQKTGTDDDIPY